MFQNNLEGDRSPMPLGWMIAWKHDVDDIMYVKIWRQLRTSYVRHGLIISDTACDVRSDVAVMEHRIHVTKPLPRGLVPEARQSNVYYSGFFSCCCNRCGHACRLDGYVRTDIGVVHFTSWHVCAAGCDRINSVDCTWTYEKHVNITIFEVTYFDMYVGRVRTRKHGVTCP